MKPCDPCPSLQGILNGLDPEAFDFLSNPKYCNDKNYDYLYCPWKNRGCPTHLRMKKTAAKCHAKGIKIPYKIGEFYQHES